MMEGAGARSLASVHDSPFTVHDSTDKETVLVWQHNYEPIAGNLGASALLAAIPIIVLFIMLGVLRKPAWISAVSALVSGLVVSLVVYGMPAQLAFLATIYGATYGMFPIAWIVFASIMLYRIAVDTGK